MIHHLRASLLIARVHLVRSLTSWRTIACLALALVPALAAFVVTGLSTRAGPAPLATNLGWMMLLQIVVPLSALIAGSAVIAEEVEDRTITFLFTRPIPRVSLLFGRYFATAVVLASVLALATFLLLVACARAQGKGALIDAGIRTPLFAAVVWGTVVYSALFASLGAFFKHPMLVGIGYAFAIEGFLANLPGKNQALTVQYYLRSLIAENGSPEWSKVEGFASTAFQTAARSHTILTAMLVVALALGAWRLARRQFELTS